MIGYKKPITIDTVGTSKGFTIVELMIALSILSVILVTASALMIRIGALYTKGVNTANLQNTNRQIIADVTSSLEFSGAEPSGCNPSITVTCATVSASPAGYPIYAYCVGSTRYSFVLGRKSGLDHFADGSTKTTNHVLWRDTLTTPGCTAPVDISSPSPGGNGYDMVPVNMRLGRFTVKETPADSGIYQIELYMSYGDADLAKTDAGTGKARCEGQTASQFCALSNIKTTVVRRVNGG